LDRQQALDSHRDAFNMRSSRVTSDTLATRGDRLALVRAQVEVADNDVGPSDREVLAITEVDEHGQRVLDILFDPDALDAANAELDRRYGGGEAAAYPRQWEINRRIRRVIDLREWDALASESLLTPDFVFEDHRPIGAGALSRDAFIAILRTMIDLRPDAVLRLDHLLAMNERGSLFVAHWAGDETAGQFEIPSIGVGTVAADGRMQRSDLYGPDQLDAARARFAALGEPAPAISATSRQTSGVGC
jgi:hypothetical protein